MAEILQTQYVRSGDRRHRLPDMRLGEDLGAIRS